MSKLYEILGVTPNASQDEIKRAYKHKAMEYHPDKNQNNKEIGEKFKDISSAYNVLSDENERRKYDQLGDANYNNGNGGGGGGMQDFGNHHEMFERFFGGQGGFGGHGFSHHFSFNNNMQNERNNRCNDVQKQYNVTLEEVYFGINKNLKFTINKFCKKCNKKCENCQGNGTINQIRNMGFITQMFQGPCDRCNSNGYTTNINKNCSECSGKGKYEVENNANLSIPKGFENGIKTVFNNLGEQPKYNDQTPGNLIIEIILQDHKTFVRKGNDLNYNVQISLIESIIGKEIEIPYFDDVIKININQFGIINPTKNYIIQNKGLPIYNTNKKGNMIIEFKIDYPKKLTDNSDINEIKTMLEKSFIS